MGEKRYNLLDPEHLAKLFTNDQGVSSDIPSGPYCIELDGKHRVFRIISTGTTSTDQYCIKQFKEHLQDAASHLVLKRWIEVRRLAYVFLVSNDLRGKKILKSVKAAGYQGKTYIDAAAVPTHQTLDVHLKFAWAKKKKEICSKKKSNVKP
jgi:hypothetical protein